LTPDTIIAAGNSIRLSPVITGDIASYQWTPPTGLNDAAVQDPLALPVTSTTYTLRIVSQDGCRASAKETVNVFYDLLMPGGFSPNGDGRNDVFRIPPSVPVTVLHFYVYNRWGEQVFATTSSSGGWDGNLNGKPQPAGVYVWQIEYIDLIKKKPVMKTGTVVLVR
jgi:gliding motility-associated-like protein